MGGVQGAFCRRLLFLAPPPFRGFGLTNVSVHVCSVLIFIHGYSAKTILIGITAKYFTHGKLLPASADIYSSCLACSIVSSNVFSLRSVINALICSLDRSPAINGCRSNYFYSNNPQMEEQPSKTTDRFPISQFPPDKSY